ncbi:MAG: succinate dehydrogenase cytochrome b subunit [Acidimicrobiia bacterium]
MAQVDEEVSTADEREDADAAGSLYRYTGAPVPLARRAPRFRLPAVVLFWRSAVGKKWVMAVSGIVLLGYVFAHMVGNLHVFEGPNQINHYGEWLRDLLDPPFPRTFFLWMLRLSLVAAFALHILAAYQLTLINRRARPVRYQSPRDYVAADFAARTMRWTGVIVGLFLLYHLLDLTWGTANPGFVRGDVYRNTVASFERIPVALVYVAGCLALGVHMYHGTWSMFQSLGINNPRFNHWRRYFAVAFSVVVTIGFISVPIGAMIGVVD